MAAIIRLVHASSADPYQAAGTALRDRVFGPAATRKALAALKPGEYLYQTLTAVPGFYARYGLDPAVVTLEDKTIIRTTPEVLQNGLAEGLIVRQ